MTVTVSVPDRRQGPTCGVPIDPHVLTELLGLALTSEQMAAVTAPLEPCVVVAGAGSGKTSVMAARVVWLVASGLVRPDQILGLTFTNKAAAELADRIRAALRRLPAPHRSDEPDTGGEPSVATYHAYAGRLLRDHGLRMGVEPSARLLADATRFQLAERVVRRAEGPFPEFTQGVPAIVDELVELDSQLSEHLVTVAELLDCERAIQARVAAAAKLTVPLRDVAATSRKRAHLAGLVATLRREKTERAVLDFGDQIALAARLAAEFEEVAALERDRYRVVLLDEYQDTSVAQKQLLLDLFGRGHPVTAVGDPCQAIYGWRGASVGNIDAFPVEFARADARPSARLALSRNNRSGGRLLDLANVLGEPLRERHPGVQRLTPRPGVEELGVVECALLPTHADELAWVVGAIEQLVRRGTAPRDIAILVRARTDFAPYHDALVAAGVPVEVVGLGGLLSLPEVADVVATLEVLDDATANAALVRLLAGPRWRIGPRDLVLLGRRAADLVRAGDRSSRLDRDDSDEPAPIEELLDQAVASVDPSEVISLSDALEDPGGLPYSPAARQRFGTMAAEIRELRRHVGEPVPDLVRRVAAVTGLDVEVAAAPTGPQTRRGEALGAFVGQAAAFADLDGDASVRAFLAFLRAAERFDRGIDTTAPSPSDSVKLMTVHKAKGLEWPVVVLPDLTAGVFPTSQSRSRWTKSASTLPTRLRGDAIDCPDVAEWSNKGLEAFAAQMREVQEHEELRLAYVAVTRAKTALLASAHWWGPEQVKARGPSAYLETIRVFCEEGGGVVHAWAPAPIEERNPQVEATAELPWPARLDPAGVAARREAAGWVRHQLSASGASAAPVLSVAESALADDWDRDLAVLVEEARRDHRVLTDVPVPVSLSASALVRLARDPDAFARELVRPMPRPPAPAARRGTRFHAWVESLFGVRPLIDRADLEGAADDDLPASESMGTLQEAFLRGPYGSAVPYRVEAPFQLVLGGRLIRGRIDAVYRTDGGYEVVDWKTGSTAADPLQLAIYRLAWARLAGVGADAVAACFYYVATGRVERPDGLPDAAAIEAILTGQGPPRPHDGR
jgi:DNA helicase II / ATP-dependent DNA helicase PcrA